MSDRRHVSSGTHWERAYGYARAVRVGDRILVAGTTATGPDGVVGPGDSAAQARFVFDRIRKAIEELGGRFEDIVRTRVFVPRAGDWQAVAEVHGELFGDIRPANTLVHAELIGPDYLVEIEAEAIVGSAP